MEDTSSPTTFSVPIAEKHFNKDSQSVRVVQDRQGVLIRVDSYIRQAYMAVSPGAANINPSEKHRIHKKR